MHREVFAGRPAGLLTVGEMPGVTVEEARLFTDPARAEVDMVFQFEHVDLDSGPGEVGRRTAAPAATSRRRSAAGRPASPTSAGTASTGTTTTSRARSPASATTPRVPGALGQRAGARVLHLHRGTPYVYQGEELGMTNYPFAGVDDFRDIESVNHFARRRWPRASDPDDVLAALRRMSRDNARTPMQWDDSPHAGFTTGHAVARRSTPTTPR